MSCYISELFSISSFESLKLRLSMKLILIQIERALKTELYIVDIYRASKQQYPETYQFSIIAIHQFNKRTSFTINKMRHMNKKIQRRATRCFSK